VSSAFNSPPRFSACLVVVPVAGRLLFLLMWGISNNYFVLASWMDSVFFVFENIKMWRGTDHLIACHEEYNLFGWWLLKSVCNKTTCLSMHVFVCRFPLSLSTVLAFRCLATSRR
jgi:hypothetical protein